MLKKTKISIVCPSYNHEKYVKYFIESVLSQTVSDFELIIVDDCSSDNTIQEIEKFNDDRIKLIKHSFNMGINATLTDGIKLANSEIISIIASDDILVENYIEEVLKIFEKEQNEVLYVSLNLIDEENNNLNQNRIFNSLKSKYEYLRQSFMGENPVPSPGMAFKKFSIEKFLPLPCGLFQYSDWDLNNKFFLTSNVYVTDKCLVNYRISTNSVSARSEKVIVREELEADMLLDNFLKFCNLENFKNIFEGQYEHIGKIEEKSIPYFLSLIALNANIFSFKKWGYKKLISLISDKKYFQYLNEMYSLTFANVISLCPLKLKKTELKLEKKYKKYKMLFNIFLILFIILSIILILFIIGGVN